MKNLFTVAFIALFALPAAADHSAIGRIITGTADPISLEESIETFNKDYLQKQKQGGTSAWYALYLHERAIELRSVKQFEQTLAPFDWNRPEANRRRAIPKLSQEPLFLFQAQNIETRSQEKGGIFKEGVIPGLRFEESIREGWSKTFELYSKQWHLKANYIKHESTKRILPGSLQVTLQSPDASLAVDSTPILGRNPGVIFRSQQVRWIGDINNDRYPDFLFERVLITGEIDYVLSISDGGGAYTVGGRTVDPDKPSLGFSSGVGEAEETEQRIANSPRPYAMYVLPMQEQPSETQRTWAVSGNIHLRNFSLYANPVQNEGGESAFVPTTGIQRDLSFTSGGETYRMLVEIVDTYWTNESGDLFPHYMPELPFGSYNSQGGKSLVVSIYHKGLRQVLLVTSPYMDGGPMSMNAASDGQGMLVIDIDYYPHYNNGMTLSWQRSNEPGRIMRRRSVFQSQGC